MKFGESVQNTELVVQMINCIDDIKKKISQIDFISVILNRKNISYPLTPYWEIFYFAWYLDFLQIRPYFLHRFDRYLIIPSLE